MNGRMFTQKQRDVLRHRMERELCWYAALSIHRTDARQTAVRILDDLEAAGFTAGTQRRAVEKIVASLDDAAPLRSVSPAERDATATPDDVDLSSGAAS